MIRSAWRRAVDTIASAAAAVIMLIVVCVWSILGTVIKQGPASAADVKAWAAANPALEALVKPLGLHQAYMAPIFLVAIALLSVSTVICSWRRTKTAWALGKQLTKAASTELPELKERHDAEIAVSAPLDRFDALSTAEQALGSLGFRVKRGKGVLSAVSAGWTVWGSAIFHWSLVLLMVSVFLGGLQRSEGQIPIAVGQTTLDTPDAYVTLGAAPFSRQLWPERNIRVDAFAPDYKSGGIDRGAVPTVSLLDRDGKLIRRQMVYPNQQLHDGPIAISAPSCGLSVHLALVDSTGRQLRELVVLCDFSETASGGTVPLTSVPLVNHADNSQVTVASSVPLDKTGAKYNEWIPRQPTALVSITSGKQTVAQKLLRADESVPLGGGASIKLLGVGWYARLNVVHDWTIWPMYAAMVLASLGLAVTVFARQQILLAGVVETEQGMRLLLRTRLWRNSPSNREEIERTLAEALSAPHDEA